MRRRGSLFLRLLLVFLGTMVTTALVLGLVGSNLYKGFFLQERNDALLEQGRSVAVVLSDKTWSKSDLAQIMRLVSNSPTVTWVYDDRLQLVTQSNAHGKVAGDAEREMARMTLDGQEHRDMIVDQAGDHPDRPILGLPVKRQGLVTGAVVVEGLGLDRHFGGVYRLLMESGLTAVACTSVMALFFSRAIARPLQEMSAGVRRMAKGDFSQKVEVRSHDEVGQLAEAFNHMADELSTLESMRREFVAHASHELRSPLTSIRGFVQAMMDGTIPVESQRPFLERIHKESERLGNLVDELLDLSRLENQSEEAPPEGEADLSFVVQEVAETLTPLMGEKGIDLALDLMPNVRVRGQSERIEQVVINLLTNAIRFSGIGGPITIRVMALPDGGRVEIEDRGIGIPEGEIERVFERFYKVDKARADSGTGLGLAIAKRIVEGYGGEIGLLSTVGQGTTAWFVLPSAQALNIS